MPDDNLKLTKPELEGWLIIDAVDCDRYRKGQFYLTPSEIIKSKFYTWRGLFDEDFMREYSDEKAEEMVRSFIRKHE